MHRRNQGKDSSERGGRGARKSQHMAKITASPPPGHSPQPPPPYQDHVPRSVAQAHTSPLSTPPGMMSPAPGPYGSTAAMPRQNPRSNLRIPQEPAHKEPSFKRAREGVFPPSPDPSFGPEKEYLPLHLNKLIAHNPLYPGYHRQTPTMATEIHNLRDIGPNFIKHPFAEGPGILHQKNPPMPIPLQSQLLYEPFPYNKGPGAPPFVAGPTRINLAPTLSPTLYPQYAYPPPEYTHTPNREFEYSLIKARLERIHKVMREVNRVVGKVHFTVPSIFRLRVGYRLRPFEEAYLSNTDRACNYFLFLFLLSGYREPLSLSTPEHANSPPKGNDEVVWEPGKFMKLLNDESDASFVSNFQKAAPKGTMVKDNEDRYRLVKWDTEPKMTYLFNETEGEGAGVKVKDDDDTALVLVRMINLNVIMSDVPLLKCLSSMYANVNETVLRMLGHYSLVCSDDTYIVLISSLLPKLDARQLRLFYYYLAELLDVSKCNLHVYYLERFIERFVPICFNQDVSCWGPLINNITKLINPLKLTNRKYSSCYISLVRGLKSFCDKFVECPDTTFSVFLMLLRFLLQSSDDSRILIRGESTDLLIQIWLNKTGKRIIMERLNYDLVRILGSLSGVQSIKLNIWSDLLSAPTQSAQGSSCEPTLSANTEDRTQLEKLFKNSLDNVDLTHLINHNECTFILNLLRYLSSCDSDPKRGDLDHTELENAENDLLVRKRAGLLWYLNNYLRINKTMFQYEKISIVVRVAYSLYKYYVYTKSMDDTQPSHHVLHPALTSFESDLDKKSSLGLFFEYLLVLLMRNIHLSIPSLELANAKLSMVLDLMLFNYAYSSYMVGKNANEKNYVKIGDSNFLNTLRLNNKCSIHLLSNLLAKVTGKGSTSGLADGSCFEYPDDSGSSNEPLTDPESGDKADDDLESLNESRVMLSVLSRVRRNREGLNKGGCLLREKGLLDVLLNVHVIKYFMNTNIDMLRMILNYLEVAVYHYSPDLSMVFCASGTSALTVAAITNFLAKYYDSFTDTLNRGNQDLDDQASLDLRVKELMDVTKKSFIYKLLLLYNISPSNLALQHTLTTHQALDRNYSYLKLGVGNVHENSIMRFMLIQSYLLLLEFLLNYSFYSALASGSTGPLITPSATVTDLSSLADHEEDDVSDSQVLIWLVKGDSGSLSNYMCRLLGSEYSLPNYRLSHNTDYEAESDDAVSKIDKHRLNFNHMEREEGTEAELPPLSNGLGYLLDLLASTCLANELHRKSEFDSNEDLETTVVNAVTFAHNSSMNAGSGNGKLVLYELLYYMASLSKEAASTQNSTLQLELSLVLRMFNRVLCNLSDSDGRKAMLVLNDLMGSVLTLVRDDHKDSNESEPVDEGELDIGSSYLQSVQQCLESVLRSRLLWANFSKFPVCLTTLIKISPVNTILSILSRFPEMKLSDSESAGNVAPSETNTGMLNLLSNPNYVLALLSAFLKRNSDGINEGETSGASTPRSDLSSDFGAKAGYGAGGLGSCSSFRFYFLYVQLLVRMYELKHLGEEQVTQDRNFYRTLTMPTVMFEQLGELEYLSRDIIVYLLNYKRITNDKSVVCYLGSRSNRSLFMYYMRGYNLFRSPSANPRAQDGRGKTGGASDVSSLALDQKSTELNSLLHILQALSRVDDIRVVQVITFSLFPVLVHTVPNKLIFDSVYSSLLNVRAASNPFTFIKFLLLTVLFSWYHKHFFSYNFFIQQYNEKRVIDKALVQAYVSKYLSEGHIDFYFNFTSVRFPVQCVYQLELLF